MDHNNTDERQVSMKDDLIELLVACEVIHHLRDLFSLFDRPQVEGAPFPAPVLFGLNLLQAITATRGKVVGLPYDAYLSAMITRQELRDTPVVLLVSSPIVSQIGRPRVELTHTKGEIKATEIMDCHQPDSSIFNATAVVDTDEVTASKLGINEGASTVLNTVSNDTVVETLPVNLGVANITTPESIIPPGPEVRVLESCNEKALVRHHASSACHSINFLVSAIAETGLVGLPSLLTAVLLQTNPRSATEQVEICALIS